MSLFKFLKKTPIDFGQRELRHSSKGRFIALSLAGRGDGKTALDLGCADGFWTERLKEMGWDVKAIDIKSDYPGCKIADLNEGIPFPDRIFDLVWSTEVIAYLNDTRFFISEIRRVLKPGGRFIITTPNNNFWINFFLKLFGTSLKDLQDPNQRYYFTITDIKQLFPGAKLYGFFPYTLIKFRISKLVGFLSPTFIIEGFN